MAMTEREKGEEEEFWFLLIPIRRAIPVAAATMVMVMVTATACCPSNLEKILLAVCWLVIDTDLVYERKILMAAG